MLFISTRTRTGMDMLYDLPLKRLESIFVKLTQK